MNKLPEITCVFWCNPGISSVYFHAIFSLSAAKLSCKPRTKGQRRETLDPLQTIQCHPQRFSSLRLILRPKHRYIYPFNNFFYKKRKVKVRKGLLGSTRDVYRSHRPSWWYPLGGGWQGRLFKDRHQWLGREFWCSFS